MTGYNICEMAFFKSSGIGISVVVVLYLTTLLTIKTEALKCHQCTSRTDPDCADPMWLEPEEVSGVRKLKTEKFLKDCPTDRAYTICRTMIENVFGSKRFIRGCGYIEHKNECYLTSEKVENSFVCQCKGDGCNGSEAAKPTSALLIITIAMASYLSR